MLLLLNALFAPGVRVCLLSLVAFMKSFSFDYSTYGLDILYGGNVFGRTCLKNNFVVHDLDCCYNNISSFPFVTFRFQFSNELNGMIDLAILTKIE